uniref:hypothetical protein n=1 Tax=Companilactobacillus kedongensis TaxID=2486004 RepID=UPI0013DD94F0
SAQKVGDTYTANGDDLTPKGSEGIDMSNYDLVTEGADLGVEVTKDGDNTITLQYKEKVTAPTE